MGPGTGPTSKEILRGFTDTTTAHGIPHIVKASGVVKKVVWILVTSGCLGLFSHSLISLGLTYLQFTVQTNVVLVNKQSLPFPAVTICNTNPFASAKVKTNPRLVQLLSNWGIELKNNSAGSGTSPSNRKKREVMWMNHAYTAKSNKNDTDDEDILSMQNIRLHKRSTKSNITLASCTAPGVVVNGEYFPVSQDYLQDDQVTYNCDFGYKLTGGNGDMTCTSNGTWNKATPECIFDESEKNVIECENSNKPITLQCNNESFINITAADFGRTVSVRSGVCWLSNYDSTTCSDSRGFNKITEACNDKRNCTINPSISWFGYDPCPNVNKYINITYRCLKPCPDTQYTITALADDYVVVYSDGNFTGRSYTWGNIVQFNLPLKSRLLALKMQNVGLIYGLKALIGSDGYARTGDGSFRCIASNAVSGNGWQNDLAYNDSSWPNPDILSVDHWDTFPESGVQPVWALNDSLEMYCRITLPPTPKYCPKDLSVANSTFFQWPSYSPEATSVTDQLYKFDYKKILQLTSAEELKQFEEKNRLPYTQDYKRSEIFFEFLSEMSEEAKKVIGYRFEDMFTYCLYDGQNCTAEDFGSYFDGTHGNCYVFNGGWNKASNASQHQSQKPGPRRGLRLHLDVMQYQYVPVIGQSAGAVIVVHDPHQMPFPEDDGVLVMPGRDVHISVKQFESIRLPRPYGDCEPDLSVNFTRNVFEEHYPVNYSYSACMKTCYQRHVVHLCGCGDASYPIKGQAFQSNTKPCRVDNVKEDDCKYRVSNLFSKNQLTCDCKIPCKETRYKYTVSSMMLPNEKQGAWIQNNFLKKNRLEFLGGTDYVPTLSEYMRGFVNVNIYYETFNYEQIVETPAYTLLSLFIDIGGIIGLFLGLTLFSLLEMVELAMDVLLLLIYKGYQKAISKKSSKVTTLSDVNEMTNDLPRSKRKSQKPGKVKRISVKPVRASWEGLHQ